MKSSYSSLLFLFAITIINISVTKLSAQTLCGSDILTQQLLAQHPELVKEYAKYEAYTQNYVSNFEALNAKSPGSHKASANAPIVYIIPIVFHILEENGPENISDVQIMDEMKILNEDWGHTNPDTGDAVTKHFKNIEGNMQVQFRLAKIDPKGNCTNGIDRIYTNLTNNANDLSKLNPWPRTKYLNVWVCKSINSSSIQNGTILGYAYFPWEVDAGFLVPYDGVIINYQCIGAIGTANPLWSRCLSHEIGHVMNLEHPFGANNSPGVTGPKKITAGVVCGDDGVNDTPTTRGFYSYCPTGGGNDVTGNINLADTIYAEECDTISKSPLRIVTENFQNFMDYSFCSMMFTTGQQERVWAALNSIEAERSSLWDTTNLIATGVYTPALAACTPVANFYSNTCFVCQGSKVNFFDNATNATPTKWDWKFTGAAIDSSTVQNPVVTFNSPYRQNVSLTVYDSAGSSTAAQSGYIYVSPGWSSYYGSYSEGFENSTDVNNNWLFFNEFNNGITWQPTDVAASGSKGSLMLNSYQNVVYNYQYNPPIVEIPAVGGYAVWCAITPSIDLSTSTTMNFSFDYSCATEATSVANITDTLEVDYSLTCGATWNYMKYITGTKLTNAGRITNSYIPSSPSEWQNISFPVPIGANDKSNVRFRFRYVSGAYSNNIYIDNVNLNGTVGVVPVSTEDFHLLVYPNPSSATTTISYYLPTGAPVQIGLYDVAGRQLKELTRDDESAGQHSLNLYSEGLANGIYFIKMNCGSATPVTQKLIMIR